MTRILALLLFIALTPLYAFGDFVPGRTRASAKADLQGEYGTGIYEKVRTSQALQFTTDGKGITTFQLAFANGATRSYKVTMIQPSRCGTVFLASSQTPEGISTLRLNEMSAERCRIPGPDTWRVRVSTSQTDISEKSELELSGTPEYFLLTR